MRAAPAKPTPQRLRRLGIDVIAMAREALVPVLVGLLVDVSDSALARRSRTKQEDRRQLHHELNKPFAEFGRKMLGHLEREGKIDLRQVGGYGRCQIERKRVCTLQSSQTAAAGALFAAQRIKPLAPRLGYVGATSCTDIGIAPGFGELLA